jgi:hypothetical protein
VLDVTLQEEIYELSEDEMRFNVCIQTGNQEVDRAFIISLVAVGDSAVGRSFAITVCTVGAD